ncbi:MAG: hypothetical protein JW996_01010 [Candidatus Cloacimonetes bacterium]|nr:hypothetical protein [Candidatus Cloacimonadota bacterium]
MIGKTINLRTAVLTWTVFIATFFWTSTMRLLLKPEISSWRIFNFCGKGAVGEFWLLPLIALLVLFTLYLESRGRLRRLYHFLIISWHTLLTGLAIYGSFRTNSEVTFGAWGISLSLIWLIIPFAFFSVLTLLLVRQEIKGIVPVPIYEWSKINWSMLAGAVLILPLAYILFHLGTGFNLMVKLAIIITIIQWILLAESLGRPKPENQYKLTVNNSNV